MRDCSRRPAILRSSRMPCSMAVILSCVRKPSSYSRAANPHRMAHLAPWAGIRLRLHRNPASISGPRAFGHLGYTGTSLWIDPDRQLSITLLTNRTWPDCQNQAIKQVRPAFHDAVIEALDQIKTGETSLESARPKRKVADLDQRLRRRTRRQILPRLVRLQVVAGDRPHY